MALASKGTILKMDVAASLTAIAEVTGIELSGAKSNTFDATLLSQSAAGEVRQATGFTTPPDVSVDLFWVPTNAGHQAITDELTTPTVAVADQLDGSITYPDSAPTALPFKIAGVEVGQTFAKDDGVKGSVKFTLNGNPTWPT